jgi:hypothetical protein
MPAHDPRMCADSDLDGLPALGPSARRNSSAKRLIVRYHFRKRARVDANGLLPTRSGSRFGLVLGSSFEWNLVPGALLTPTPAGPRPGVGFAVW